MTGSGDGDAIVVHAIVVTHECAAARCAVKFDTGNRAAYFVDTVASDSVAHGLGSGAFALLGLALLASAGLGLRRARGVPAPNASH